MPSLPMLLSDAVSSSYLKREAKGEGTNDQRQRRKGAQIGDEAFVALNRRPNSNPTATRLWMCDIHTYVHVQVYIY